MIPVDDGRSVVCTYVSARLSRNCHTVVLALDVFATTLSAEGRERRKQPSVILQGVAAGPAGPALAGPLFVPEVPRMQDFAP